MQGSGVDVGVLGVLPVRATQLDSASAVDQWLRSVGSVERSRQVGAMSRDKLAGFVSLLDSRTGPDLIGTVDPDLATRIVQSADAAQSARWLEAIESDEAAEILRRLPDPTREQLFDRISEPQAQALRELLRWPPTSVAAHMLPDVFTIPDTITAAEAETLVRTQSTQVRGRARVGALIYVTDADRRLIGFLEFQDLVLAQPDQTVSELSSADPVWVRPLVDAEQAAQSLVDYDLAALPVVDDQRRLLGVLTADAAADIIETEATRDAERQGGSEPLEVPYLRASPFRLWRKRIVWLLVLFVAEAYTGTVLRAFEDEMEAVVALAFFIPLLIGTGGNTGTQITTTLVRAMGTGQVRLRDLPRVLAKEMSTGFLVALTMAAAAIVRAWTLGVGPQVTITVSLTVAAIVLWSALVSSILPLLLKKCRVDPAVVSAPMIATIVDGTGLIIYFLIAHATLPQLAGL
ncbi:magnesium transporter [Mycobacterium sp. CVI_P3]|uniref:Magnesium transporter MgtE n=1 Tax=Mycobacterium pinniadriaticum TaxID=2994102 RepID=A0ABT3SAZ5_9MYCO|nr:magnesium transporter [Mycobacterium pinniadriaticum]MCX2930273.1 magnesium transporter [Mycobacterium pinniadriaticum]MCX2936665.1 magnesium transporter [Mycobacterium pinniadriaticum]